jgi:hypothetical protein
MENDNKKIPKVEEHLLSALKEAEKEKRAQRISEGKKLAKQKREQEKQKSAT